MEGTTDDTVVAVSKVVSEATERPMEELPTLSRVIDINALDRLVSSPACAPPSDITVTFEYAGLHVVAHSHGLVYATPVCDDGAKATRHSQEFHP